jgi:Zn-dependent M28 family amino/carboxypeptidase
MRIFTLLCVVAAVLMGSAARADQPADRAARWWSHIEELANDRYEGRFTGTAGYSRAASYVANRFREYGLQPAGTQNYLQRVPLIELRVSGSRSTVALTNGGSRSPLALGGDILLGSRMPQPEGIDAPLVFIGYGLHLPEAGYDDFADQDLRGKIAVYLNGGPGELSAALKSHARAATFWKALERSGAVGAITIANPKSMDIPWPRQRLLAAAPGLYHEEPTLRDVQGEMFTATFNPAEAEKLFEKSGRRFADLLALADQAKPLPRFPLEIGLQARVSRTTRKVSGPNVVGLIPGSDPALAKQYVVLTAHLDHLGVGEPVNGDRIYNGAMDNGSGIATLLELAQEVAASSTKPRRSILFVAVTGEERGRLGSRWFARFPTVPREALVANVNTDMFLPLTPFGELTALGIDESTLGDAVRAAALAQSVTLVPDPQPDRNSFIRSDQYSFISIGIPALIIKFAAPPGSKAAAIQKAWLTERYHAPSDELAQSVNKQAAVRYNLFLLDVVQRIADSQERPAWLPTSFFRRFASDGTK